MYRGFKIEDFPFDDDAYYKIGENVMQQHKARITKSLDDFIYGDNILDADLIQSQWYPQVNANIFISHSHNDTRLATCMAGWLYENFHLKAFIDSLVWGYADELLKEIDKAYCFDPETKLFDYNKRNSSTSHIHAMLSSALTMMIDKTECLFFLKTPDSIAPRKEIGKLHEDCTFSPWIYHEITISQLIENKDPIRPLTEGIRTFSKAKEEEEFLRMAREVNLSHLITLDFPSLALWSIQCSKSPLKSLDWLYQNYPAPEKSKI